MIIFYKNSICKKILHCGHVKVHSPLKPLESFLQIIDYYFDALDLQKWFQTLITCLCVSHCETKLLEGLWRRGIWRGRGGKSRWWCKEECDKWNRIEASHTLTISKYLEIQNITFIVSFLTFKGLIFWSACSSHACAEFILAKT